MTSTLAHADTESERPPIIYRPELDPIGHTM